MPRLPFNLSSRPVGPVRTIDDAAQFGLPVLGSICEFEAQPGGHLPDEAHDEALEAYERLIGVIRMPDFHVRGHAIVVASVPGGSGGTTIARNLATLLSQGGSRTIVADADTRRVARRRAGDGTASSGFGGLLVNRLMRSGNALIDTDDARLKLLPAGRIAGPADDLLKSSKLPRVVDRLRELADYVIFDAGSVTNDLRQLTRLADVTLLVLRSGRTSRKAAGSAADRLRDATPNLIGFVLNQAPVAMMAPAVEAPPSRVEAAAEAPDARADRLEIAVDELLANLEAAVSLVRELRTPAQTKGAVTQEEEDDSELVTLER